MNREFVVNQSKKLMQNSGFCNNSINKNAPIYAQWEVDVPNLGLIYFITWKAWHSMHNQYLYKTVGICYNDIEACILKRLKEIIKTYEINYDILYDACFNKYATEYNWLTTDDNGIQYIRFDEKKTCQDESEFNKEKIENIIIENLLRKKVDFIKNKTTKILTFINEYITTGLSKKEMDSVIDELTIFEKKKFDYNRVVIGKIPKDVQLTKLDIQIENKNSEDLFEIKTNIYR